MKKLILLIIALIACSAGAQGVQIGTLAVPPVTTPSAALEVVSTTQGFLTPRMTAVQMNAIPSPATGLIVYCTNCTPKGLWNYTGTAWAPVDGVALPVILSECTGFEGAFAAGVPVTGASYKVTITNNSFSPTGIIALNPADLILSGVTGLTVGTPTPASIPALAAGGVQVLSYPITGTPATTGTLSGAWSKISLACNANKTVGTLSSLLNTNYCTTTAAFNGNYIKDLPMNATGNTFTVTLNNTSGFALNNLTAPTAGNLVLSGAGAAGLTVATVSPSSTFSLAVGASQTITYTLSGTPTTNGAVTAAWSYYDLSCSKTRSVTGLSGALASNYCNTGGFTGGALVNGVAFAGHTFSVAITNNSGSTLYNLAAPTAANFTLAGPGTFTVTGVPPTAAFNLAAGATQTFTYTFSGTPNNAGTLTATFKNYYDLAQCDKTKAITNGVATLPASKTQFVVSTLDGTPAIDVQGVINNTTKMMVFKIPYTGGSGSYPASTASYITGVAGQGGDSNGFTVEYAGGTFAASGTITVTIKLDNDGSYNAKKQLFGIQETIVTLPLTVGGSTICNLIIKAVGGIPDRRFGETTTQAGVADTYHDNVYLPITSPATGKRWLNNNLGTDYSNTDNPSYNLFQQATSSTDRKAYGSLYQWGRYSDGHELMNWAGAAPINGTVATPSSTITPTDPRYIATGADWLATPNNTLWQPGTGTNNPCPVGFRVPTQAEYQAEITGVPAITNGTTAYSSVFKFVLNGYRQAGSGGVSLYDSSMYTWTSTVTNALGIQLYTTTTNAGFNFSPPRSEGASIRCISE